MISCTRSLATLALAGSVVTSHAAAAADIPSRIDPVLPVAAQSPAPVGGLYFATRTGVSFIDDTSFRFAGGATRVESEYETGIFSSLALGYSFGPVLGGLSPRFEVEGIFGDFSVDQHVVNGRSVASVDSFGELQGFGGFASTYLDIDLGATFGSAGLFATVRPFVGVGIGLAHVELKKQGVSATGTVIDDADTRLAYQLSAGLGVDLSRLGIGGGLFNSSTLEVGYRFLQAPDLEFKARDGTQSGTDLTANIVTVGFRRQF